MEQGILSKVNGEHVTWACPFHPVGKFDESGKLIDVRITCNSKTLNKALIPVKRHIPSVPELTRKLAGSKIFSIFDFKDAFNQLSYDKESRALNVMATPWGLYCWNRLNMGISTASEIFQETMVKVLGDIPNIEIAMDDVLVHTKNKEEHDKIIKQVLERISTSGMTLNPRKCKFYQNEVDCFGITISAEEIRPKKAKYRDFIECEEPTNTKEVRSFLGCAGYFKTRSPDQSAISKPLRDLLKVSRAFKWDDEEKNAYNQLKQIVIEESMAFFNHLLPIELYVDAGPFGCSSFLTQIDGKQDTIKLVRCDSHSYTQAEERYSHLEKEAFACVWACKTNHIYVYGRPFKIITDALAVKKIFQEDKTRKRTPIRFIRWKSDLSVYNATFVHRAGFKNIADYLSRRFKRTPRDDIEVTTQVENQINAIVQDRIPTNITLEQLISASNSDPVIQEIKKALALKKWGPLVNEALLKPFKGIWTELSFSNQGILLRNDVIVIPESLRHIVIEYAHEGHIGMQLCKRLLRNICWFPRMDSMIEDVIEECIACQANTRQGTSTEPIIPTKMPKLSWDTIALDHTSRSPTNDYGLGVLDEASRTTFIKTAKDLTSNTAIQICKKMFAEMGIPRVVKTDNGPAFISKEWKEFAKKYKFHHQKITPLHPEANAGAERIMQNNNKTIRCANVTGAPWKRVTSDWLRRYNQTPHSSTGFSPNMLLLGNDNCDILPNICPRTLTPAMKVQARLNDALAKMKMKKYADASQHVKHRHFQINDPVLHKWSRHNKYVSLFDPHPYRVKRINGSMIVAGRDNHAVTRNSKFFKIINEKCFLKALEIVRNKLKTQSNPSTSFKTINHRSQVGRQTTTNLPATPPPTPALPQTNEAPQLEIPIPLEPTEHAQAANQSPTSTPPTAFIQRLESNTPNLNTGQSTTRCTKSMTTTSRAPSLPRRPTGRSSFPKTTAKRKRSNSLEIFRPHPQQTNPTTPHTQMASSTNNPTRTTRSKTRQTARHDYTDSFRMFPRK